jgi:uncharacterized protein (DUF1697 family)
MKYIALLRGINVSGQKSIKMDALKKAIDELGFSEVKTYIQSGNIVFESKKAKAETLVVKIKTMIAAKFGLDVPVLVYEQDYIKKIFSENPFLKKGKEEAFLHVTFLSSVPDSVLLKAISVHTSEDEFLVKEQVVYLYCPKGYGVTKLSNNFFESKLKLTASTRNWKTVGVLAAM